jgi:hypothetical protein
MKTKLIKNHFGFEYFLADENGSAIATSDNGKLSKQNCDEIFGIYNPSELSKVLTEGERGAFEFGYCLAREHNKSKLLSEEVIEDNFKGLRDCIDDSDLAQFYIDLAKTIFCETQPTEIEVEIEMEEYLENIYIKGEIPIFKRRPKLDDNGRLILKKIEQ